MTDEFLKSFQLASGAFTRELQEEFSGIRTNRPTPKLVEDVSVEYAGQSLRMKQLGSITVAPPREIQITVWDKNAIAPIAKALQESPLGLNPNIQGNMVRLQLPPLTEERRAELVKVARAAAEKIKIRLRALRDETNKQIESAFKTKTMSEDQKFKTKSKVQELVDKANGEIEGMVEKKTREIAE